jgi:hypothetical protein
MKDTTRWAATLLFAVSAGCTVQQAAPPGGDAGQSAPAGLSCLDILKCIVECPDSDTACPDACGEKGSSEGQTNILALASCIDKEKCTTGPCVTDKCAAPLQACVDSSQLKPATPPPLVGNAPPGRVPSDLVGEWAATTNGTGGRLILKADGTGSWLQGFSYLDDTRGSCLVIGSTTSAGNIIVEEIPSGAPPGGPPYGKITVYATSVIKSFRNCSGPLVNTNEPPATLQLQWFRDYDGSGYQNVADPNLIFIIDSDCAAKYEGQKSPVAMYCTTRVRRQ